MIDQPDFFKKPYPNKLFKLKYSDAAFFVLCCPLPYTDKILSNIKFLNWRWLIFKTASFI